MLNKYDDFILEKRIVSLILENDLRASEDFMDRLDQIKSKSKVAAILFSAFDFEEYISADLPQNWIDITDKEDKVTFISDVKADAWMRSNDDSPFIMKGRNEVAIGRFARGLLKNKDVIDGLGGLEDENLTDKDFEDFVNLYKSTHNKVDAKFELVDKKKIKEYYNEANYANPKGQLGSSCMRYNYCEDYLNIYVKNPESIKLLVYLNSENKVLGRALVWKLKSSPCGAQYFMDRIYTSSDSDVIKFQNFADQQGWLRKFDNTSAFTTSLLFTYQNKPVIGQITIELSKANFHNYPFMDTVSYISVKNKFASNLPTEKKMLECTDTEGDSNYCDNCNGEGKYEGVCKSCYGTGEEDCVSCNGDGDKRCQDCRGTGIEIGTIKPCESCEGKGRVLKLVKMVKCKSCDGKGQTGKTCERCKGTGDEKCESCNGKGEIKCEECKGKGETKGDCPDCIGLFKSTLIDISKDSDLGEYCELAKNLLQKLEKPKKEKK